MINPKAKICSSIGKQWSTLNVCDSDFYMYNFAKIMTCSWPYPCILYNALILLWKESLNSDGHQFHQYQQNKQSPLILTEMYWVNIMKLVQKRKGSVRISDSGCSLLYMNIWKLKRSPPPSFSLFRGMGQTGKKWWNVSKEHGRSCLQLK